jgi:hypothetical protein
MPVKLSWYLEDRVVLVKFLGMVTVDELVDASYMGVSYIEQSIAPYVHFVHDASELIQLPRQIQPIIKAAQVSFSHPRVGWIVAYQVPDRLTSFTGNLVSQVFRVRYRIFDTKPQALAFLQTRDATLPDLASVEPVEKVKL